MANLRISVVLATYKRADILRETLEHLAAQTLPPDQYEIIVIDDGSQDATPAVVEEARTRTRAEIRFLEHPNRGPGYTQNQGLRAARAPVILLIADDIYLCPEGLEAHLRYHDADPTPGLAVLGRVVQSPKLTHTVFLSIWNPFRIEALPDRKELPYHMFWACNISMKREFMLSHGMFNEVRGRGGAANHEDAEVGYRMHPHGLRVIFARDPWAWHYHIDTWKGALRRSYERGVNWYDLRHLVPEPEMEVRYRTYDLAWLWTHRKVLRQRREYLLEGDRSMAKLVLRHLSRLVLFNNLLVDHFWMPLFALAERNRWVAKLMRENMYRGVIVNYFLRGRQDVERRLAGLPYAPPGAPSGA